MEAEQDAPLAAGALPTAAGLEGLRVLMLTPSYSPRVGGVERHVACVARELRLCGLSVMVATPRWSPEWPEAEEMDGIPVVRLSRSPWVGWRELSPWVQWAQVVHSHDAYPFLKYYLPHRLLRPALPVVVTFHGYEGYPIPWEARVLRAIVSRLTRGAICAGAFIPKWYGCHCDAITHGGVDAPAQVAGQVPQARQGAVFVGRLEPDTGFLMYLDALCLLKDRGLGLSLDVCGEGSLLTQAQRLAVERGLDVRFHGVVTDPIPYLSRARFAFVSGFLAILQAMASGAVVLAVYDNPLKHDYLTLFPGARYLCIAGSAEELVDHVQTLLRDPEAIAGLTAAAAAFAATQTWAKVADLYLTLYRSVIRRESCR